MPKYFFVMCDLKHFKSFPMCFYMILGHFGLQKSVFWKKIDFLDFLWPVPPLWSWTFAQKMYLKNHLKSENWGSFFCLCICGALSTPPMCLNEILRWLYLIKKKITKIGPKFDFLEAKWCKNDLQNGLKWPF